MLHVTNGDIVAETLAASGIGGSALPWRDVLHDGPVPGGLTEAELRRTRAEFLASTGAGEANDIELDFATRDDALASGLNGDEVILWFEHDLYDQLQLIQILDRIGSGRPVTATVSLVIIDRFPGVEPFHGLGQLNAEQLESLFPSRAEVTEEQLALAVRAWDAFTAPQPARLAALSAAGIASLPFLGPTLARLLQEFPDTRNGLARSEWQLLAAIAAGAHTPVEVFQAQAAMEDAPFLGDLSVWNRLDALSRCATPLITRTDGLPFLVPPTMEIDERFLRQGLRLTDTGEQVHAGRADHIQLNGIDRWVGGVHLHGGGPVWRWDEATGKVVRA